MTSWSILFEKMSKYDVAEVKLARTCDKLQLLLAFTRWKGCRSTEPLILSPIFLNLRTKITHKCFKCSSIIKVKEIMPNMFSKYQMDAYQIAFEMYG